MTEIPLGEGWSYLIEVDFLRHAHPDDRAAGHRERAKFPFRCKICGAIMPERFEFPVRVAQMDYEQQRHRLLAMMREINKQMALTWRRNIKALEREYFLDGEGQK